MCYYYWKTKGVRPSEIYNASPGEKLFIRACYELELEEKKQLAKKGIGCPYYP